MPHPLRITFHATCYRVGVDIFWNSTLSLYLKICLQHFLLFLDFSFFDQLWFRRHLLWCSGMRCCKMKKKTSIPWVYYLLSYEGHDPGAKPFKQKWFWFTCEYLLYTFISHIIQYGQDQGQNNKIVAYWSQSIENMALVTTSIINPPGVDPRAWHLAKIASRKSLWKWTAKQWSVNKNLADLSTNLIK